MKMKHSQSSELTWLIKVYHQVALSCAIEIIYWENLSRLWPENTQLWSYWEIMFRKIKGFTPRSGVSLNNLMVKKSYWWKEVSEVSFAQKSCRASAGRMYSLPFCGGLEKTPHEIIWPLLHTEDITWVEDGTRTLSSQWPSTQTDKKTQHTNVLAQFIPQWYRMFRLG